jgi:hypothetical protein
MAAEREEQEQREKEVSDAFSFIIILISVSSRYELTSTIICFGYTSLDVTVLLNGRSSRNERQMSYWLSVSALVWNQVRMDQTRPRR